MITEWFVVGVANPVGLVWQRHFGNDRVIVDFTDADQVVGVEVHPRIQVDAAHGADRCGTYHVTGALEGSGYRPSSLKATFRIDASERGSWSGSWASQRVPYGFSEDERADIAPDLYVGLTAEGLAAAVAIADPSASVAGWAY